MAGMPAARVTDMHVCPLATPGTPPIPHVGGPIVIGAPTVLTGGLPQARVGDMCVCVGPPDAIATGAWTVLVSGSPAARISDLTVHGGSIVAGLPTVIIGMAAGQGGGGSAGIGAFGLASVLTFAEPAAQAKAWIEAARAGTPFCEICGSNAAVASEPGAGGGAAGGPKKSPKGGSTTVTVDDAKQTVTIRTKMEFGGPDATPAYAAAAKKQIEESWSGTMMRNGKPYNVNVIVDAKANPGGKGAPTPGYDQIIVDGKTNRMRQTLYGAGPGWQTPAAATDTARPRRIAHEYGHSLGLPDDYVDSPTGPKPKNPAMKNNLMAETWPDAKGVLPHPHQSHYEQVLKNYGL